MSKIKLFIFMGISGSGKSTIQHELPIKFLTNCTTRKLREGEINGYHIDEVSEDTFLRLIDEKYFFEHAEYAGNHYGTPNYMLNDVLLGTPYHCTKEVVGALQLKEHLKEKAIIIYIKPPSIDKVIMRMFERGDNEDDINKRIKCIQDTNELENEKYADYIIVNDDLNKSILEAHRIVIKELIKK